MSAINEDQGLSLVRGDFLFRLQRRMGLIPKDGLGLVRRAVFWALVAWLPLALWAALVRSRAPGLVEEPLLAHFGVQVRCLLAIPLLVLAEGPAHAWSTLLLPEFVRSGLVPEERRGRFRDAIAAVVKLRDATLPWILIFAFVVSVNSAYELLERSHEVNWGLEAAAEGGVLGFGGWWFVYVARPIYLTLLLGWIWRVVLLTLLCKRIAGLELELVPTHPDKAGGLGFLENVPKAFALVTLAASSVLASRWAHDVVYHGVHVTALRVEILAFLIMVIALFSLPLFVFTPLLVRTKRQALLDYGALIGGHGRLVHDRWIRGRKIEDDSLLSAPELGPVADTAAAFDAVRSMRGLLIGKASILPLAATAALPMLALLSIEIPVKTILGTLAKALF